MSKYVYMDMCVRVYVHSCVGMEDKGSCRKSFLFIISSFLLRDGLSTKLRDSWYGYYSLLTFSGDPISQLELEIKNIKETSISKERNFRIQQKGKRNFHNCGIHQNLWHLSDLSPKPAYKFNTLPINLQWYSSQE